MGLLGDPVQAKIAKEAPTILKSSYQGTKVLLRLPNVSCFACNLFTINVLLSSLTALPAGDGGFGGT